MRHRYLAALCISFALMLPIARVVRDEMSSHPLPQAQTPAVFVDSAVRSDDLVVAFTDDFSTNPNSGGRWVMTTYRSQGDLHAEAAWDATKRTLYLTRAVASRGTALFANYPLATPRWRASFRYRNETPGGQRLARLKVVGDQI